MNNIFTEPLVRVCLCEDSPFGLKPHGRYDTDYTEDMITFSPLDADSYMQVNGLVIGRQFHWQQHLDMRFEGVVQLHRSEGSSRLLNILKAERYLTSVVGSEMNPHAPVEFIKAHAVIARSWLIKLLHNARNIDKPQQSFETSADRLISWVSASPHTGYDVCPDDHCQRYQGLDAVTERSAAAVAETRGVALTDCNGIVADTRYSKCCGGQTELYSTCWDDRDIPYLRSVGDPYCHPDRLREALRHEPHLLKDYDMATTDYYEWTAEITKSQVRDNLKAKFGIDIGDVLSLRALRTGASGRISHLLVSGSRGDFTIGKELNIRALLSDSHLYSSAFTIEDCDDTFVLHGRGWGHGVGLCQTGAAVMAAEGASHTEILQHYYPDTQLQKIYD